MHILHHILLAAVLLLFGWPLPARAMHPGAHLWSDEEKAVLRSLWLGSLPAPPDDPSNRYDTDLRAVALGRALFFDNRLSVNGMVSCATCHIPEKTFTDSLPVAHGIADTTRRSMPLAGSAYSPWLFWDGRADSLWAQALGPIESPAEHGLSRTRCVQIVARFHRLAYEDLFGPLPALTLPPPLIRARPAPDEPEIQALWLKLPLEQRRAITRVYVNIGKAIAAFVRTIQPAPSRFDRYVQAVLAGDEVVQRSLFSEDEAVGLKLFIGKAGCIHCHNGPLFTNNDFHNLAIPSPAGFAPDPGRAAGISKVLASEFNCLGPYSDAPPERCGELRFIDTDTGTYQGAFKVPSLRNVADRPPYMHAGQFATLAEVLAFYQRRAAREAGGRSAILHGPITDQEARLLATFLKTLSGPVVAAQ